MINKLVNLLLLVIIILLQLISITIAGCTGCIAGQYCNINTCASCTPAGTWSNAGDTTGPSTTACTTALCGNGNYCSGGVKAACPAGKYSSAGASHSTDCYAPTSVFVYTGATQTYTVPFSITKLLVEAYGGSGSTGETSGGGGGFLNATLAVIPGQVLQVTVGGSGDSGNGYNGGGQGTSNPYYNSLGGGATDIRVSPFTVNSRVIVVGGGGGGAYGSSGACGGGLVGCQNSYSSGGSQTAGGVLSGAPSGTNLCCSDGTLAQGGMGTNCGGYCCGTNGGGGGGFYGGYNIIYTTMIIL